MPRRTRPKARIPPRQRTHEKKREATATKSKVACRSIICAMNRLPMAEFFGGTLGLPTVP